MEAYLGRLAKLYIWNSTVWEEVASVRDLTNVLEHNEVDVSRRGTVFRQKLLGLADWEVTGQMVKDHTDTQQQLMKTALEGQSTLLVLVMDQANDTTGSQGWQNTVTVRNWTENQGLEDGIFIDFTLQNDPADDPIAVTGPTTTTVSPAMMNDAPAATAKSNK